MLHGMNCKMVETRIVVKYVSDSGLFPLLFNVVRICDCKFLDMQKVCCVDEKSFEWTCKYKIVSYSCQKKYFSEM